MHYENTSPEGMHEIKVDLRGGQEFSDLEEFSKAADEAAGPLNFVVNWSIYDEENSEWGKVYEVDQKWFEIVFVMPRRNMQTWSMRLVEFDRAEVMKWFGPWLGQQVEKWYGLDGREIVIT